MAKKSGQKVQKVTARQLNRDEIRRQKVEAMRLQDLRRERYKKVTVVTVATVVALALIAVIIVLVTQQRKTSTEGSTPPGVTSADGGYVLPGNPVTNAPTLDIWEDLQCPACKNFESTQGQAVTELASSGQAKVVIHVITLIGDHNLGNDWSQKAAEAAAAADAQGKFLEFHRIAYANQPAEGAGFTDAQLEDFAKQAGVKDINAWRKSYKEREYENFVKRVEKRAEGVDKIQGTPTIRVGSREIEYNDAISATPDQFKEMVLQ